MGGLAMDAIGWIGDCGEQRNSMDRVGRGHN